MAFCKRPTARDELDTALPFSDDISVLSTPFTLEGRSVPNRICYQPMEGCDGTVSGAPDELTRRRYLRFASGGAGLIWFEATAIVKEGRANPRQLYLDEGTLDGFQRLIWDTKSTCVKENGYEPVIICQLTHSGRWSKPEGASKPLIAYNKPIFEKEPIGSDSIVDDAYLDGLTERYESSARLCEKAGFDGIDVKACHGYLLSELLNAYQREGRYGGSYENRTRLLMDATSRVKSVCRKGFIISSRFNAYDGYAYPYGIGDSGVYGIPDFTEAARIASDLEKNGASLLNVTMGCPYTNNEVNRPTSFADQDMPYDSIHRMIKGAAAVSKAAPQSAVVLSGISFLGALAPNVASACILRGDCHFAGFGRQSFSYPELARDIILKGEMSRDKLCLTCGKCTELMRSKSTPGCVVYDKLYLELYRQMKK